MRSLATPMGFRDVLTDEASTREAIVHTTQTLLAARGYRPIETPTLEVMDLVDAGRTLSSAPIKFFDGQGELLALRPDVTLQVARMAATHGLKDLGALRLRYTQRVFRDSESEAYEASRELTQVGAELIGESGIDADLEIAGLMCEVLNGAGVEQWRLAIADVSILRSLLQRSGGEPTWQQALLDAFHDSDFVRVAELTKPDTASQFGAQKPAPAFLEAINALPWIQGGLEAIEKVRVIVEPLGCAGGLEDLKRVYETLTENGFDLVVDFSVMSSFDYYTGIVFVADSPLSSEPIGAGGRYDQLLARFGAAQPAAGFAFCLEAVMEARSALASRKDSYRLAISDKAQKPLRLAVPKGALNNDTVAVLRQAGLDVSGLEAPGRLMVIDGGAVEFIIVRPSDAPIFVALGGADCGICGADSLVETGADVVELVDLGYGGCRFVVAEKAGQAEANEERYRTLGSYRVATKYPNVTRQHFAKSGTSVEIVRLHGNIELAPLAGLSERIVDITATGTTLRENNLVVVEEVMESTARFFANPSAWRTDPRIRKLARALESSVGEKTPS